MVKLYMKWKNYTDKILLTYLKCMDPNDLKNCLSRLDSSAFDKVLTLNEPEVRKNYAREM